MTFSRPSRISKRLLALWAGGLFSFGIAFAALLAPARALAWYDHKALMPWIVDVIEIQYDKNPHHPYTRLKRSNFAATQDPYFVLTEYRSLAELLLFNPRAELPSAVARTPRELLTLAVDDPDHGMDQGLPDSADPRDERRWMGGTTGTPSQGFRHQYFAGWNWNDPISSFQVPYYPIGQALDRFELLANEGRAKIREGKVAWGLRILGWSLHYLQDMTQPFHTNQVPSLKMLPLTALLHWPPTEAWENFVRETTRTIGNYHWAYEGYVRELLLEREQSPLQYCLVQKSPTLLVASPRELISDVVAQSRKRSSRLGSAIYGLAGSELKDSKYDLARKRGQADYHRMRTDPALRRYRDELQAVTCESLALAKAASLWMVEWAFRK